MFYIVLCLHIFVEKIICQSNIAFCIANSAGWRCVSFLLMFFQIRNLHLKHEVELTRYCIQIYDVHMFPASGSARPPPPMVWSPHPTPYPVPRSTSSNTIALLVPEVRSTT